MVPHALSGLNFVERFYPLPDADSTNTVARTMTAVPRSGLFVIQSDTQRSGRGRQGNTFFSAPGGLWVSVLTRIPELALHFNYNRALSLAVRDTLVQAFPQAPVRIKWPNDVLWGDRKICGILLEKHAVHPDYLVIGFGLNVNIKHDAFPEPLRNSATSIFIETGKHFSLVGLLREVLAKFSRYVALTPSSLHEHYVEALYRSGSRATVDGREGVFTGVAEDGRLMLNLGGETHYFTSGTLRFVDTAM